MTRRPAESWLRRQHLSLAQALIGIGLVTVIGATPLLVLWEYTDLTQTIDEFGLAQNVTGTLADAQRDAILLELDLERLDDGRATLGEVRDQSAFLGQQLRVLDAHDFPVDVDERVRTAVEAQRSVKSRLDALDGADRATVLAAVPSLRHDATVANDALHGMYSEFENSFYSDLADQLRDRRDHQVLILWSAVLALVLGAGLTWSLRQSIRRDFDAAYLQLETESAERIAAQVATQVSERRFLALVQDSTDVTLVIGADRRVTYASPSAVRTFAELGVDVLGAELSGLVHPSRAAFAREQVMACFSEPGRSVRFDAPLLLGARDDDADAEVAMAERDPDLYVDLHLTNLLDDPAVRGIVVNARDVTERTRHAVELGRLAYHDRLTGLPNRLSLERELDQLDALGGGATVLTLDIDDFRSVNHRVGDTPGDAILRALAARLSTQVGRATAYHFGGDEFALLVPTCMATPEAEDLVAEVRRVIAEPVLLDPDVVELRACIGVVAASLATVRGYELLRHADATLHEAKRLGPQHVVVLDEERACAAVGRAAMAEALSHALARNELEVHFQPIVLARDRSWGAVEALLRWNSPTGPVSPAEFIPIAEQSGLIVPIGRWVMATAATELVRLRALTGLPLHVNINVAARQLLETDLMGDLEAVLERTGLPPDALVVELTESAVLEDPDRAIAVLTAVRAAGIHVALDDFGTGYSSLSYLLRLPVSVMKIDRAFLRDVTVSERTRRLLGSLVEMAHDLGVLVTVEGVETEEEMSVAVDAGCDAVQGFLFSRPMPADALVASLPGLPLAVPTAARRMTDDGARHPDRR